MLFKHYLEVPGVLMVRIKSVCGVRRLRCWRGNCSERLRNVEEKWGVPFKTSRDNDLDLQPCVMTLQEIA
jgi:hypothetical protein